MISLNSGYDERGLLSLAFHPDYASNGRVFLHYTAPPTAGGPEAGELWNNLTRISEFTVFGTRRYALPPRLLRLRRILLAMSDIKIRKVIGNSH